MPTLRTWLNARRRSMGWVGISVVLFVIVIARIFAFRPFGFIQRPFVAFGTWVNTRTTAVFGACSSKATEFEQLKTQRDSYAIDQASYQALKLENETLKKELGFLQQRKLNAKAASILSRSVSGQTYNFVIDVGSSDHVVEGAAVIVDNGIFIGKVTHVDQRESIVAASTDYRLATGVSLQPNLQPTSEHCGVQSDDSLRLSAQGPSLGTTRLRTRRFRDHPLQHSARSSPLPSHQESPRLL